MKLDINQVKTLAETGDITSLQTYILGALEKSDVVTAVGTNAEVKSFLDSEKDKHHSVALETWKTNHLQGLLDEAVAKANPSETPEQKQIRELQDRLNAKEAAEQRSELRNKALTYATEKGIDPKFVTKHVDRFLADDEESTHGLFDELKTDIDSIVQAQVEAKLKVDARQTPGGASGAGGGKESFGASLAKQTTPNTPEGAEGHYFK